MTGHLGSIADLLRARRGGTGRYVAWSPDAVRSLTFGQLDDESSVLAARLTAHAAHAVQGEPGGHAEPGDGNDLGPVVLSIADPLSFITAFFAVTKAGGIPVPGPVRADSNPGHRTRLLNIVAASRPRLLLTGSAQVTDLGEALSGNGIPVMAIDAPAADRPVTAMLEAATPAVAYVQYTSGSIADPKPIPLRQDNVLAQLRQAARAFDESPSSVSVNWVPLYHDMGLVTSVLRPLWSDYTSVILDPFTFVRDPSSWITAMTEWKATHTSAPDFGYALCTRKVAEPARFDLRTLAVARSAGELVRASTLRAFAERFSAAGFRASAFKPSYGLAEAVLSVTTCPVESPPTISEFSRAALRRGIVEPPASAADVAEVVSCGLPLDGTEVRILRADGTHDDREDVIGEVWIHGPQVLPDGIGSDGGRRTGDIGFRHDGQLLLLGRSRDRFQVRGENFYSAEIEAAVTDASEMLRPGRCAAFLTSDEDDPGLVVLAELRPEHADVPDAARVAINRTLTRAVGGRFGLAPRHIRLVPGRHATRDYQRKAEAGKLPDLVPVVAIGTTHIDTYRRRMRS